MNGRIRTLVSIALSLALLAGCGSKAAGPSTQENTVPAATGAPSGTPEAQPRAVLKVGATPEPWAPIVRKAAEVAARENLEVQLVEFNDYVKPNMALADGEIDVNLFQHQPYLEQFKAARGLKVVAASEPLYIVPMAVYSQKVKALDAIPEGAVVAVPNDPVNQGRALLLLQGAGLIQIAGDLGAKATVKDLAANPRGLKFQELEAFQLPRSLSDVDLAVIPGNVALGAKLSPRREGIFVEQDLKTWANIIATREGEENRPEVQTFLKALKSQEVRDWLDATYNGAVYPVYDY